uniref:Uncharacterized protein n=1 Tax=Panagrolaimus sp. ES5 TaxID=591445 RepID=A0AC34GPP7_9BILA
MGASSSTVTAGIKNQVDGRSNAIYQLADVTGNGVLADIAKESVKSKDPTELDIHIKTKVRPFLYNGGDGAELPIHDVIAQRHKERHGTEFTPAGQTPSVLKKFICWRLDARGAVGETVNYFVFHI